MKKIIILSFCLVSALNSMEQQPKREPREWNAQDYAKGNSTQQKASLWLLSEATIDLTNKIVYDGGCGTGNISAIMAQKAKSVHGFDPSSNMIEWALLHYDNVPNLSFEQCFAEDFSSPTKCNLFTLFFCLHWIKDKKMVFQRCYDSLESDGELLGNIRTAENGQALGIKVLNEILPELAKIIPNNNNIVQSTGSSYPTEEALKAMLEEVGFKEISLEKKALDFSFKTTDEVIAFERPVVMSRPFIQSLSEEIQESVFTLYIAKLLEKLERTSEGYYINPEAQTTVIYCRK